MKQITASRSIAAPVELVFDTVANIEQFRKAIPHIVKVEFLSDARSGVGTKFRETRLMKGKEATTDLEVTEYVENDRIRIVSDTHGTVWDTVFTVAAEGERTLLTLAMDINSYKLIAKITTPLISGMLTRALEADMDSVKEYCEEHA